MKFVKLRSWYVLLAYNGAFLLKDFKYGFPLIEILIQVQQILFYFTFQTPILFMFITEVVTITNLVRDQTMHNIVKY